MPTTVMEFPLPTVNGPTLLLIGHVLSVPLCVPLTVMVGVQLPASLTQQLPPTFTLVCAVNVSPTSRYAVPLSLPPATV